MSSTEQRNIWLRKNIIKDAVVNRRKSEGFMKLMLPAVLSSIIKKRIALPDEYFSFRQFRGVPYNVLKSKITDPVLQSLQKAIKSITDVFDKQCLNKAYLLICNNEDPDQIYECYTLNFDYKEISNIEDKRSALEEKLTERTVGLLISIHGLNSQNSFKREQVLLRVLLRYYNNDNPQNSQSVVVEESMLKLLEAREKSMKSLYLSVLKTGFHTLKCSTDLQLEEIMNSSAQSESDLDITIDDITDSEELMESDETFITNKNDETIMDGAPEIEMTKEDKQQTSLSGETNINYDLTKANPEQFKCSCGIQWRIPSIEAVQCKTCLTFHHCICVGQLKADQVPNLFECYECDNTSLSINFREFNIMCLMLIYMNFANTFPNDLYYKLSEMMQKDMIKRLKIHKVILEATNGYTINIKRLKAILAKIEARFGTSNVINLTPDSMELK